MIASDTNTTAMMEDVYHFLNKNINIDKDRQWYTAFFDSIRKLVLNGLKMDEYFRLMFCDIKLTGSYADKLKISVPDEFDTVMNLKLPYTDSVIISRDEHNKGNVLIDLTDVLINISATNNAKYYFLSGMVNNENFLLQNKISQWIESCMTKFLKSIDYQFIYEQVKYKLIYRKSGPAHTIYVQNIDENEPLFSVDFVPVFTFDTSKSVSSRVPICQTWDAVPKPLKCAQTRDNPSFISSFSDSDRKIMIGKNNFKVGVRLMKKYRDLRPPLQHLKSFYIKTLFLWLDEENKEDKKFWNLPLDRILRRAFKRLEDHLHRGEIKSFWNPELNLLHTLKSTQIDEMYKEVAKTRTPLEDPRKRTLKLFLSPEEEAAMTSNDLKLLEDSWIEENTQNYTLTHILVAFFSVSAICYLCHRFK